MTLATTHIALVKVENMNHYTNQFQSLLSKTVSWLQCIFALSFSVSLSVCQLEK